MADKGGKERDGEEKTIEKQDFFEMRKKEEKVAKQEHYNHTKDHLAQRKKKVSQEMNLKMK